jgi:prepilin-type N-terminal cleavage/methylation domain-containing protein
MKTNYKNLRAGFTLIEIMIGLGVSAILILGLTRLYSATLGSYSLQEQLTEMNQNAKFTMKEVSDVLMQAGADCGLVTDMLEKDTVIKAASAPCNSFTIKINPRGGLYTIVKDTVLNTYAACSLKVDNAYSFRLADKIGHVSSINHFAAPFKTYTLNGLDSANNKLFVSGGSAVDSFYVGDGLYSFKSHRYYLNGTNLCLDSDNIVMAENIDSLNLTFMDSTGASTTSWSLMRSVALVVEATTSVPDNRYVNLPWNDHRRRLKLTYQFRLKNKV